MQEKFYLRSRVKLFGLVEIFKSKESDDKRRRRYYVFGVPFAERMFSLELAERERLAEGQNSEEEKIATITLPAFSLHREVFPKYRGICAGKEVVVVGAGPTLDDYIPISGAIHIGVNKTFLCEKLSLDYLFIQDYFEDIQDAADAYRPKACKKFYGYHPDGNVGAIPEVCATRAGAERYFFEDLPLSSHHPFPPDISRARFGTFSSVIFPALQFALWMHPKRIYLVGCDCTSLGHCRGITTKTSVKPKLPLATKRVLHGWHELKKFAERFYPDVEIVSVNPVGLKGVFRDMKTQNAEIQ